MLPYPIVQIAYFVSDAEAAAHRAAQRFGAGPFFLNQEIRLAWGEHRGDPCSFVHTSAYGQWGNVMMELVQQDSAGPSPFRDMYAEGEEGIHHMAMIVDSLPEAYTQAEALSLEIASRAVTSGGTEFAFIDTVVPLGHMLEVYERSDLLLGFYDMVAQAARGWDGSDPVRRLAGR